MDKKVAPNSTKGSCIQMMMSFMILVRLGKRKTALTIQRDFYLSRFFTQLFLHIHEIDYCGWKPFLKTLACTFIMLHVFLKRGPFRLHILCIG